jgi:membrane protease subunit (stomatin/prohibitin family)
MTRVKTYLAQVMRERGISIFEVDEQITEFSAELKKRLEPDFADYGIKLERFFITRIVKPEGDSQYEKFRELHFRQYADIAEAKSRQQMGVIEKQTEILRCLQDFFGCYTFDVNYISRGSKKNMKL